MDTLFSDKINSMKKYFVFILLSFLSIYSFSQDIESETSLSISGKLLDSYTGDFLPYAHIYNVSQKNGTITDNYGFFKLKINEQDTLNISFVGYKTLVIKNINNYKTGNEYMEFKMTPEVYTLSEVIINPLGTYEQFKWNIINLKLPESETERINREINVLAKREIDKVKNFQPKFLYDGGNFGYSGGFDVTGLASVFARLEEAEIKTNQNKILTKKYNRDIVHRLSGYEGAKLDSFVIFCNQKANFNYLVSEFDITVKIYQLLDEFSSERDTL